MALFPTLSIGQVPKYFGIEYEDNATKSKTEGGYVLSRPKFSRRPRRTVTTGFEEITQADFDAWESFYRAHGTYKIFTYVLPTTGEEVLVRFAEPPKPKYVGIGGIHRWNIPNIKMEEA